MISTLFPRRLAGCLTIAVLCLVTLHAFAAPPSADGNFPGVQQALTPEQYEAAGLGKLSAAERAKLDNYLRGYFTGETQRVVQQTTTKVTAEVSARAVDQAIKENRVTPPEIIESSIVGKINNWKLGKVFRLANGQYWKVTAGPSRMFSSAENPPVVLVKDFFSYRMAVPGVGVLRVTRVTQ